MYVLCLSLVCVSVCVMCVTWYVVYIRECVCVMWYVVYIRECVLCVLRGTLCILGSLCVCVV